MWFRNLQIYQLYQDFELSAEELHDQLEADRFTPCGSLQLQSQGWVSPLGRDGRMLTHAGNGCIMLCARREDRLLPGAVVREALADKVAEIEAAEARDVGRKEQSRLKDEIVQDLLPRAFTRSHRQYAYIDPKNKWIVVDSATPKKAEELISLLRESLGSLRVRPLQVAQSPAAVMTAWLAQTPADGFVLQDECELREPVEGGGIVRCRRQDLDSDEIGVHLNAGKQVAKVALEWNERIGCVLCDDLSVKRLRFLDLVMEEAADTHADDEAARFDADFALMNLELSRFIPALLAAFGGLAQDDD